MNSQPQHGPETHLPQNPSPAAATAIVTVRGTNVLETDAPRGMLAAVEIAPVAAPATAEVCQAGTSWLPTTFRVSSRIWKNTPQVIAPTTPYPEPTPVKIPRR